MSEQGFVYRKSKDFGKAPEKLMHNLSITDGAVRLYAHMHWRFGSNHKNFEGQRSMAEDLGVTEKTISNRVKELEAADWVITVFRDPDDKGHFQTPFYHVFEYQEDCQEFRAAYQPTDGEKMRARPKVKSRKSRKGIGNPAPKLPPRLNPTSGGQQNSSSDGSHSLLQNSSSIGLQNSSSGGQQNSSSDYPDSGYPDPIIQTQGSPEDSSSSSPAMTTIDNPEPIPEESLPEYNAPSKEQNATWDVAYSQIEIQLDRENFVRGVQGAKLLGVDGATWIVVVRNNYAKENCQHRLYRNIHRILSDCFGQPVELRFEVSRASPPPDDEDMPLHKLLNGYDSVPAPPVAGGKALTMDDARKVAENWPKVNDREAYAAKVFQGWVMEGKA